LPRHDTSDVALVSGWHISWTHKTNDWGPIAVLSTSTLLVTFALIAIICTFTDRRPV